MRQYRRIESHGILYHKYHLDSNLIDVLVGVLFVLQKLDDRQQQIHIAKPAENVVYATEILVGQTARHLFGEGGEHYDR